MSRVRVAAAILGAGLLAGPALAQDHSDQVRMAQAGTTDSTTAPRSFAPFQAKAGQPAAQQQPAEPTSGRGPEPSAPPAPGSPVPQGVHLSPLAPIVGADPRRPPPPTGARREAKSDQGKIDNQRQPPAQPANARRRANCTEILQRATIGELSEEDRAILRTQCR
jgi:hypothetical protein